MPLPRLSNEYGRSEQTGTRGTHELTKSSYAVLTLIIGAVVGLVVVAFIVVTERLGSRLYPPGGAPWRRLLIPVVGSLLSGFLLFRYFPDARGSGIPQTKVALFLRDGYISLRTVLGKFGLCSISLASGIALGREGPSVQVKRRDCLRARAATRASAPAACARATASGRIGRTWQQRRSTRRSPLCSSPWKK